MSVDRLEAAERALAVPPPAAAMSVKASLIATL
jgi:hypothetical protein